MRFLALTFTALLGACAVEAEPERVAPTRVNKTTEPPMTSTDPATTAKVPSRLPLDAEAPERFATATFALG